MIYKEYPDEANEITHVSIIQRKDIPQHIQEADL